MKTIIVLPLIALGLAACEPYAGAPGYPQPYPQGPQGYPEPYPPYPPNPPYPPYPGPPMPPGGPIYPAPDAGQAHYRAIGTEPFWDLEIGPREMRFTDRGNDMRVVQPTPVAADGPYGRTYRTQRLEATISPGPCSDGMSERSYPDRVQLYVDGRLYRGCGAPIAFFGQIGETGQPHHPGAPTANLSGTNWRVVAMNGARTPASDFYINFMPDRIGAKFGCNSIGAAYTQSRQVLTVGALMATQMACPDMSFENQGMKILEAPMTISGIGDRLTLSNGRGSIELIRSE